MPPKRAAPKSYEKARKLRKELTPAERKLWAHIRNDQLGVNFRRQHAIGNFIPDFVCIKKKLIVELDGGQHAEQAEYDADRTRFLESQGYKVIRFWNNDVMNDINGVIRNIQFALEENQGVSV
ncbi:MAG: endonuclease [Anaerolineaceae bacterium]|nr:MAG: endonuclease [Anaerolineaceae bacterium]